MAVYNKTSLSRLRDLLKIYMYYLLMIRKNSKAYRYVSVKFEIQFPEMNVVLLVNKHYGNGLERVTPILKILPVS